MSTISSIMPDQRVSSKTKREDKDWYVAMANFVIDLAVSSNDKSKTISYLNAANGILDPKDYSYVMKTYMTANEATEVERSLEAERLGKLRNVDILTPIKEKYMGEFITSYHNYQVYSLDPDIVFKRNHEIGQKVSDLMFQKLQEILKSGESKIDVQEFVTKEIDNWKDETVAKEQAALELLNSVIDAKRKYIDAYFYWWACEEVYTYRRLSGNDVIFEVVNPLEYYRVDSGNYLVEDDHYGLRRYTATLQEIIDIFYNNMNDGLTEVQMDLIKKMIQENNNGIAYVTPVLFLEHPDAFQDKQMTGSPVAFTKQGFQTTVDHWVAKTEVKRGILTYMSPTGPAQMDVDETYKLNRAEGDIDIEWKWIDQYWEGWVFGETSHRIYIPPRPIELQRELISNVSICKNPYNGASYIHKSSAKNPIAFRIKDNMALYKIYTLLEERWLNKFKSWLAMPESILADSDEMSMEDRVQQADIDSMFPFNDLGMERNPNAVNMFREVATTAIVNYIQVLNQIKQSIKQDTWELANYNAARAGQNNPYKGKGVNEQDYNQALMGSVWSLEMFNAFREKDYLANLDYSRAAWIDGKQGSFIDPNTKEIVYVDVDGLGHLGANMGISIANSAELNSQAQALKELAFSMGQNDDPAIAAEAVTNKNISKLKLLINKGSEAKKAFQLQMSTAKEEAMGRVEELRMQNDREQREHEVGMADAENANKYDIAILESETQIAINEARLQVDTNGNGYVDAQEAQNNQAGVSQVKETAMTLLNQRKQSLAELKMGRDIIKAKEAAKSKSKSK